MMKKIIAFCIAVGCLIGGANVFGPSLAAEGIYQALSQKMELSPQDVQVHSSPGAEVFFGQLDEVQVHVDTFAVGDVPFERFDCVLRNVQFDPLDSLMDQRLVIRHADRGDMTASVRCEALRQFLLKRLDDLSDVSVTFADNEIVAAGDLKIGGFLSAHATIRGAFGMNGSKLMFIPSNITVEGLGMKYSGNIGSAEIYDFQSFPLGLQPDDVTMDGDFLTIRGQIRNS